MDNYDAKIIGTAYVAGRSEEFGESITGSIEVDMKKVKARKDEIVRRSNEGVESWLKGTENLTVSEGHARFTQSDVVEVGDKRLQSDNIFIDVGGRA